ncbi:hypothetical protein CTAYLR_000720 [Chrysophaeum taylorii]|uniref:Uncharacterized protein n=1 Tax=Chrysophaeum taylorii TaxID=2483200 RepID=A0AAD7U928_9STRA|nr:hypothetical protein CTAYLR_000720 [Chrysophaeum taylorii]
MSLSFNDSKLGLALFEAFPSVRFLHMKFNPKVTFFAAAIIWGFIAFTSGRQKEAYNEFTSWGDWVGDEWSWFYIGSQDIWVFVLLYVCVSKYGSLKLGGDDEAPEFSRGSWFAMLFAAGVGVGLFYYGVAEPMWHYNGYGGTRWNEMNDNDRAQHSLMVTFFHWGFHGWIPYTTIGALLGIVSFRKGYPCTIRSCFVPLLGEDVLRGALGDAIDVVSICSTLFGVCTSLGLGVQQLNKALVRLDKGTYMGINQRDEGRLDITYSTKSQIAIIWVVTALATASVVSGLGSGIKFLSNMTFVVGCLLMIFVLFAGDTVFILNAITSAFGYYLWYLPKISWHTDAFEMLDELNQADNSAPGAPDERGGSASWMGAWTIFYWGWWISWAPFVGTFIAKISRGRTLREFIAGTLIIPTMYCVLWFGVFGAEGLRLDRQAEAAGLDCGDGGTFSSHVSTRMAGTFSAEHNQAYKVRLWCLSTEDILFDTLSTYGSRTMMYATSTLTALCLLFYFVTSSDSGSLVIDSLAANGDEDPPILQRVFWAVTEGAAATALLSTGKERSLRALQSVSIVCGLPYTFILCYMCYALVLVCKEEKGELSPTRNQFRVQLLNINAYFFKDGIAAGVATFLLNACVPTIAIKRVMTKTAATRGETCPRFPVVASFCVFLAAIVFLALTPIEANLRMVSATCYLAFAVFVTMARWETRVSVKCERGDVCTDYIAALILYPLVLAHCEAELDSGPIIGVDVKDLKEVEMLVDKTKSIQEEKDNAAAAAAAEKA